MSFRRLEFDRSIGVGATLPPHVDPTFSIGPVSAAYFEKPSLFYTPLEGDKFVRQMLTPISLETLLLLTRSGWSIERVTVLAVQTMNGLKNAPSASGPTPEREPEFHDFREAVHALRALQTRGLVDVGQAANREFELHIASRAVNDPDAIRFRSLLKLDPGINRYRVVTGIDAPDDHSIAITTRAMTGVLYYLSQGVQVPASDENAGRVTRTHTASGEPFDWNHVLRGVFSIETAPARPDDAAVAVPYRGSWFYIRDTDLQSKTSFSLLAQLMTLQAGPAVPGGAALSFSVGGP